jgi:predicted GNAT family acetyltransferase
MKIERQEHGKRGAFYIEKNGVWIAEMTYVREGARTLVIDHTAIAKQLRGKGIGKAMVKAAVKYAEKNKLLIKPTCPYVKKVLSSSEEYEDILAR